MLGNRGDEDSCSMTDTGTVWLLNRRSAALISGKFVSGLVTVLVAFKGTEGGLTVAMSSPAVSVAGTGGGDSSTSSTGKGEPAIGVKLVVVVGAVGASSSFTIIDSSICIGEALLEIVDAGGAASLGSVVVPDSVGGIDVSANKSCSLVIFKSSFEAVFSASACSAAGAGRDGTIGSTATKLVFFNFFKKTVVIYIPVTAFSMSADTISCSIILLVSSVTIWKKRKRKKGLAVLQNKIKKIALV